MVSNLELVWWRMCWKFVNAQVITMYTLRILSQATNCSQTWMRRVSGLLEPWEKMEGMGGVDFFDYILIRPVIRGKKWYWPLVINALNIGFVYSWWVFGIVSEEPMPQKNYCPQIVGILIQWAHLEIISVHLRPARNFWILDEIRFDGVLHYPISWPVRRCVLCGKNSRKACEKCKLTLHLNTCFQIFHEQ